MTHDNRTLMRAVEDLRRHRARHPECFDGRDVKALEGLAADTHWLLSEAYRGPMNDPRHHQVYDRIHATLKRLEHKQADYARRKDWEAVLIEESKFNPYHKPAGTPEGGQFDFAPGNGGGAGIGSPRGTLDPEKPSFPQRLWRETFGSKPAATQYPDSSNVSQRVPKPIKELSSTSHGVKFVATHERFRSKVYDDGFGNRTIGYGHVLKPAENFPRGVSKSEALNILSEDMKAAESRVRRYVRIDLRDHEFDALASFSFNAGYAPFREKVSPGKYRNTALLDFLNCGDRQKAADEFLKYNKATNRKTGKKEPVKELTERRKKEREMFLYGIYKHKEMSD